MIERTRLDNHKIFLSRGSLTDDERVEMVYPTNDKIGPTKCFYMMLTTLFSSRKFIFARSITRDSCCCDEAHHEPQVQYFCNG